MFASVIEKSLQKLMEFWKDLLKFALSKGQIITLTLFKVDTESLESLWSFDSTKNLPQFQCLVLTIYVVTPLHCTLKD